MTIFFNELRDKCGRTFTAVRKLASNNNNNNNVTYTAQIRQSRKCAATCQRQTGMFSVDL